MRVPVVGRDLPVRAGAGAGVAAWLVGYLCTYLLTAGDVERAPLRQAIELLGGDLPTWKVVGWIFFNAHFVDTIVEGPFGGATSFVGGENGFTPLLFVLPPVLLAIAGLAVLRYRGATEPTDGALVGSTVVVGYLPCSIAAAVLVATTGGEVRPEPFTTVFVAGVVYPLLFGAAGAAIGAATAEDGRDRARPRGE